MPKKTDIPLPAEGRFPLAQPGKPASPETGKAHPTQTTGRLPEAFAKGAEKARGIKAPPLPRRR